jgi:hypothetical protein
MAIVQERQTTDLEKEVFLYLNELRESGAINMFGAASYIVEEFPQINIHEARQMLQLWMRVFNLEGNYDTIKAE